MNMKLKNFNIKAKKYKITSIMHSGRRNTRYKIVTDDKYDGLMGSIVVCKDLDKVKRFECIKMRVLDSPFHKVWETSPVISLWEKVSHFYYCETVNSIYILSEVADDSKVKCKLN